MQEAAVPDAYAKEDNCGGLPTISHLSLSEIQNALLAEPCIREVIVRLQTGETPSSTDKIQQLNMEEKRMMR